MTSPARCHHSFPDPYPAPLSHIGNCRHCGVSYQDVRAAMTPPTIAQLHNLTDRAAAGLTPDEQARLREGINRLAALQAVARDYCPHCGRGDAAPTVEDWEHQRQRADEAEAQLRLVDAMRQQNLDAAAAAIQRAETALARVQALADEYPAGIDTALIHEALDQTRPAATQATEPAHNDGPSIAECRDADRTH